MFAVERRRSVSASASRWWPRRPVNWLSVATQCAQLAAIVALCALLAWRAAAGNAAETQQRTDLHSEQANGVPLELRAAGAVVRGPDSPGPASIFLRRRRDAIANASMPLPPQQRFRRLRSAPAGFQRPQSQVKIAKFIIKLPPPQPPLPQLIPMGTVLLPNLFKPDGPHLAYWFTKQSDDENLYAIPEFKNSILIKQPGRYQITAQVTFYEVDLVEEFLVQLNLNGSVVASKRFNDWSFCRYVSWTPSRDDPGKKCVARELQADFNFLAVAGGPTTVSIGSKEGLPMRAAVSASEKLTYLFITRLSD